MHSFIELSLKLGISLLALSVLSAVLFKKIYGSGRWYFRADNDGFWVMTIAHFIILMAFYATYVKLNGGVASF